MSTTDGDNTITRQPSSPNGPLTAPVVVVDDDHASQDVEAAQKELDDKVLLGKRSCMESIVLCFANLIPPLGVA